MGLADIGRDIRQAFRSLITAPGFAAGVVLSLTLGIVANTAAFSFLNAAVFRPFPGVSDQHELARLSFARSEGRGTNISSTWAEYETLAASIPALSGLAAHYRTDLVVTLEKESSALRGAVVSRNYFDVLGVRPSAGRFFERDASTDPVVVISHDLWTRRFEQRGDAIGRLVLINGATATVIGVAAPQFHSVRKGAFDIDVWLPPELSHLVLRDPNRHPVSVASAGFRPYTYVGRRAPGASLAAVEAQAAAAVRHIDSARAAGERGTRLTVERVWLNDPADNVAGVVGFMTLPLLVLIIACVNAGNLLLARASRQMRDWQVRLALGATGWRIVRQVLAECLVLSVLAAGASLFLTSWALQFVAGSIPVPMPLDARVQAFTIAVTVVASLAFGLGPALRVARRGIDGAYGMRSAHVPSRSRVRSVLIALQAAVSLGLLATGAQFVNTARTGFGRTVPEGANRLLIASMDVDPLSLPREAANDFYGRVIERSAALEGVMAAGLTTASPLAGTFDSDDSIRLWLPGDDRPNGGRALAPVVSGRYFDAVLARLIAGRYFTSADETASPRTAIVSESFAKRYLSSKGLGVTLRVAPVSGPTSAPIDVEVVGIVGPESEIKRDLELVYLPAPLVDAPARSLFVRFDETGRFGVANLQQLVRSIDYRVPIRRAATLRDMQGDSDAEHRLLAGGTAALGLFALALAAGGLYGVVSYIVALRRREIGVRLALGATRAAIVRLILWQGLLPAAIGALVGAGVAATFGVIVRSRLHGVAPVDPLAFAGASAVLLLALCGATVLPAREAARVDPVVILRQE
jgi:predicted permease